MPDTLLKNRIVKVNLASQPTHPPHFSVHLKGLKGDSFQLADPKATRALLACMNMEAVIGGAASHWGGPSAFAEIISSMHALIFAEAEKKSKPWFELFHIINDAGHCENGFYALKANYGMAGLDLEKLKTFRSLGSPLSGHGEVHLFPESVYLSNGPLGSCLAQAQGLSMSDKLLGNDRISLALLSDGACMEGETKEALTAIPGFASKNQMNPFLLIVSDNNTKLSGRIDEDSFSLKPFFKSLPALGWDCSFVPEGNHLETVFHSIESAIEKARENPKNPVCLVFKTCKGFGVKKTMEDPSGGHGFPLKNPEKLKDFILEVYEQSPVPKDLLNWCEDIKFRWGKRTLKPQPQIEKVQKGISKALIEQKKRGRPIVSISSDLYGSTGLADFKKTFPHHSFDVGVAEAGMISVGIGFSKQGFIPVVDTFAQFAVTKGALPLIMSALSQAPLLGVFSHAGLQDAADGASHQALSYFAKSCSLPHTQVYALSCSEEAYHLVSQSIDYMEEEKNSGRIPKSQIFFLGREEFPKSLGASSYSLNKAQILFDQSTSPSPVLIVSSGPLVYESLMAAKEIHKKGRGVVMANNPCVSDPDINTLGKYLQICQGRLICVEDHQIRAGMSSILVLSLQMAGIKISKIKVLGMKGGVGRSAYQALDLYRFFNLDRKAIEKVALEL